MITNYKNPELLGFWATLLDAGKGIFQNLQQGKINEKKQKYLNELIEQEKKSSGGGFDYQKMLIPAGIGLAAILLLTGRKK